MINDCFNIPEKSLKEGCYMKSFLGSGGVKVIRIEKKENNEEKLVAYAEKRFVLAALADIANQFTDDKQEINDIFYAETLIDHVIEQGYCLKFFVLPNQKILSIICERGCNNDIPIRSVITDDLESGFKTLNATLNSFDFHDPFAFPNYVEEQTDVVYQYQKKLAKIKNNK